MRAGLRCALWGAAAFAVALAGTWVTQAALPAARAAARIGPESVWNPPDEGAALHECPPGEGWRACVRDALRRSGISREALAFYDRTDWFLVKFTAVGPVDLGVLVNSWMANDNWQLAFLNGEPQVLLMADALLQLGQGGPLSLGPGSSYADVAGAAQLAQGLAAADGYAEPTVWPGHQFLEGVRALDSGGAAFTVQFDVVNGCHACGTGYRLRLVFAFGPRGAYEGTSVAGLCRTEDARVAVDGVPDCVPAFGPSVPGVSHFNRRSSSLT